MKIGLDATPLLGERSGVGNYTGRLLAALLEASPQWEYLLYSKKPLGQLEPALARATPVPGYLAQSTWLWMQTVLPRVIQRSDPHLCHFTNALAPLVPFKPYVLTIHDASLFLHREHHPRVRILYRIILPILARQAAAVITISNHARHDLLRVLNLPANKVHVIYEAAPSEFKPVDDPARLAAIRQKYDLPAAFLLYVGTIEPRKNLGRLLQALKQVRRAGFQQRLVMVGPSGWMMDKFNQQIAELGLETAVQYIGYVPAQDLPVIYSLATLFLYPSLYEGFGLPPMEAMACGTPVLSSNRSSLAEIYADSAHLVDPESVDCLAEGIISLLRDNDRRQEMRQRGLERVQAFSWQRTAEETMAVYRQIYGGLRGNGHVAE